MTLLDSSPAMLDKARERLERLPQPRLRGRVTLVQADGEQADEAVGGRRFDAVLCHGVLGYLEQPEPLVDQLCRCAAAGGLVSIMTANAKAAAVRPALERRWDDALAAFDARTEIGVLGRARAGPTRSRSSASSCGSAAWSRCTGTACGCSSTGSSSAESSWTPSDAEAGGGDVPRSSSKPADGTPTASSAGSFTWWAARVRAEGR